MIYILKDMDMVFNCEIQYMDMDMFTEYGYRIHMYSQAKKIQIYPIWFASSMGFHEYKYG